ncbi:membrane protein [Streptomyces purpurascens]
MPAGSEARVHLRMDNVSRLPTGLLMLQDRVPYVLGPQPRFVLDRVEAGEPKDREVSYRVRSDLRGRYPLGPLQLRLTDPFGMCELTRSFSTYDNLTVIPRVEPLAPVRLSGEARGYGDGRQRSRSRWPARTT